MSTRRKLKWGIGGAYIGGMILIVALFGATRADNPLFHPAEEFKLLTWLDLPGPMDLNKGVLYLFIATALTIGVMTYVSKRMQGRPNRVQTAVEWAYTGLRDKIVRDNMDDDMARKWFPLVFTLFVFIWISNMIGYIPLPVNSGETFNVFGADIPSFQIYAATANVSIPLVLALIVFVSYNVEGLRAQGFRGYAKSVMMPPGVKGGILIMIVPLEILSQFLRLISLTVRLFANLLAGHMLIQFMSGGLAVLLGLQVLAWFTLPAGIAIFLFEVTLIAGLQAFIFAILTCIYLGSAVSQHH
ncbi:MAG: F-type H+-transporting ATPase subunit a [Solirubrobacteraceae bacterium]|jgi:F-type H+-transporting ATPase subunit a|nr:F-type H+-transporting ATPase subunit a [Solirubrobacteraceae bacterium]